MGNSEPVGPASETAASSSPRPDGPADEDADGASKRKSMYERRNARSDSDSGSTLISEKGRGDGASQGSTSKRPSAPVSDRGKGRASPRPRQSGSSDPEAGESSTGDADGIVLGFRKALQQGSAPSLEALFGALDSTGDGRLSAAELMRASQALGVDASEAQLEVLIKKFDPDGSGQLDADEFARMCEGDADDAAP